MNNQVKIPIQIWEDVPTNIGTYMRRMKVPGGWLISDICDLITHSESAGNENNYTSSICFMPDPNHEWLQY